MKQITPNCPDCNSECVLIKKFSDEIADYRCCKCFKPFSYNHTAAKLLRFISQLQKELMEKDKLIVELKDGKEK